MLAMSYDIHPLILHIVSLRHVYQVTGYRAPECPSAVKLQRHQELEHWRDRPTTTATSSDRGFRRLATIAFLKE